jgi:hypothetical protein
MKKLILLFAMVALFATTNAQSILKPIPNDYFAALNKSNTLTIGVETTSFWAPRLNGGVQGVSYFKNKVTNKIDRIDLSALCFGIGFLHYKNADGVPFNDFGFNLLLLQNLQKAGMGIGIYGTYNTGPIGLLNLGVHRDFEMKQFLIDTGLTFHF